MKNNPVKFLRRIAHLILRANLYKTLIFNFKVFPLKQAIKLPIVFYGKVTFSGLSGKVLINTPVRHNIISFGLNTDGFSASNGSALVKISGTLEFMGPAIFSVNNTLEIIKGANLTIGEYCAFGNGVKIRCWKKISIGRLTRFASESQLFDTNFHHLKNAQSGEVSRAESEVVIGSYNWIGNRASILKGTKTPDWCIIASSSLLNKDYSSSVPPDSIIGGLPAKLIRTGYYRVFTFHEDLQIFNFFNENPHAEIYHASKDRMELRATPGEIFPVFK